MLKQIRKHLWVMGLIVAISAFAAPLFAAPVTTETRALTGFTKVKLAGSENLILNQGEYFDVKVTGPADFMDKAITTVRNGTLEMSIEGGSWFRDYRANDFLFFVTMPHIEGIYLSGSGNVEVGPLDTQRLSVSLTGSGDMEFKDITARALDLTLTGSGDMEIDQVKATEASATISGSGDIDISGNVQHQIVQIRGSGNFNGRGLSAESASGSVMGSGDVKLGRVKQPSIQVMGSGNVSIAR